MVTNLLQVWSAQITEIHNKIIAKSIIYYLSTLEVFICYKFSQNFDRMALVEVVTL